MNILYEDNHLIAVEKEAGMLTQGDYSGDTSLMDLVKCHIKEKYGKQGEAYLGMLHRLDRPVSGIVLFARTSKAASRLSRQFREGAIGKFYLALISGKPAASAGWTRLDQYLVRGRGHSVAANQPRPGAQKVSLRYTVLVVREGVSLVLVRLLTGKKHQIRAQFASQGMPIAGDADYGSPLSCPGEGIMLHACALSFVHPTKNEKVLITCPVPEHFSGMWRFDDDTDRAIMESVKAGLDRPENNI